MVRPKALCVMHNEWSSCSICQVVTSLSDTELITVFCILHCRISGFKMNKNTAWEKNQILSKWGYINNVVIQGRIHDFEKGAPPGVPLIYHCTLSSLTRHFHFSPKTLTSPRTERGNPYHWPAMKKGYPYSWPQPWCKQRYQNHRP